MGPGFGEAIEKALMAWVVMMVGVISSVVIGLFFLIRWLSSHITISWN